MVPRIVHQTAKAISPEEASLVRRLRRHLPGWEYRLWTDAENRALVHEHFPQYAATYDSIGRGVVKADLARYMYLAVFGGFYFDTDYKLLVPIGDELRAHACVLPISRNGPGVFRLGNAVMGSEPGHRFWREFLEHIFTTAQLADVAEAGVEATTGPEGLTAFFVAHRDRFADVFLPSREVFHPEIRRMGFGFARQRATVGAHLCWGSWRTKGTLGMLRALAVRKVTSW